MNDETYAFIEDVKTRKGMANGAKHKKTGSKTKICRFPSDYLTKKEKAMLNSDVVSYNLNNFYSFEEFRLMPSHIQQDYVNYLIDKWHISTGTISTELLGKSGNYLDMRASKNGWSLHKSKVYGPNASKMKLIFVEALKASKEVVEGETVDVVETKEKPVNREPEKTVDIPKSSVDRLEIAMTNGMNYKLLDTLVSQFTGNYKVTLIIESIE